MYRRDILLVNINALILIINYARLQWARYILPIDSSFRYPRSAFPSLIALLFRRYTKTISLFYCFETRSFPKEVANETHRGMGLFLFLFLFVPLRSSLPSWTRNKRIPVGAELSSTTYIVTGYSCRASPVLPSLIRRNGLDNFT